MARTSDRQTAGRHYSAKEVKYLSPDMSGKVLGIKRDIDSDAFFFEFRVIMEKQVTRRNMLSLVSSLYDPLGLIGPFTLTGKLLLHYCHAVTSYKDAVLRVSAST